MEINYERYLDGDEWPSESLSATVNPGTGEYEPALEPVFDMVPQKAVAALHKLIRWAHSLAITVEGEEREEARVRQSNLGRLLARKALRIEDFELYQEHGVDRNPLGNVDVAKALCHALLDVADMEPVVAARLATETALTMNAEGYVIYKEAE